MVFTLDNFYQSKEWRNLLAQLKNERLNEDGQVICQLCGKPIVRAYDIIGHHVQELTEENVNDYTVSLNPDNVIFLHAKCHNVEHNKLGYKRRKIYLVYGAPLSGKSSFVDNVKEPGDLIIDMDNIWEAISGLPRYEKPNRLKSVAFKVRDCLLDCVKYRNGKYKDVYIIGGYPLQSERERIIKEFGAEEIFIDVSMAECLERLKALPETDGRRNQTEEWEGFIRKWFELNSPPLQ